jgi:hypothetical protein
MMNLGRAGRVQTDDERPQLGTTVPAPARWRGSPMEQKYGRIAGNTSINAAIYTCFELLAETDRLKFLKAFRDQPHDGEQVMNTFRELVMGAFLARHGLRVVYDHPIDGKTPDWTILNDIPNPTGLVELVNYHGSDLYQCLQKKCVAYKRQVERHDFPYAIGLFPHFFHPIDSEDLADCLLGDEHGLFRLYPGVSGLLYFEEFAGRYYFHYRKNGFAERSLDLPPGMFNLSQLKFSTI